MWLWIGSLALVLTACGGASFTFDDSDAGTTNDGGAATTKEAAAVVDAGTATDKTDGSTTMIDAGDGGVHPPNNDTCPQNADYASEFSVMGLEAPRCGANRRCSTPSAFCCYYDGTSDSRVCLPWFDGG